VATVATVGTFNLRILRPICELWLPANQLMEFSWEDLGLPEIFNDSAIYYIISRTTTGGPTFPCLRYDFRNG
jgi:hypothetical protein